jgi:hypothetical protein
MGCDGSYLSSAPLAERELSPQVNRLRLHVIAEEASRGWAAVLLGAAVWRGHVSLLTNSDT